MPPILLNSPKRTGVYFGMIGYIKGSLFPVPRDASKGTKIGYDLVAGITGGTLATIANTPFDVVSVAVVDDDLLEMSVE